MLNSRAAFVVIGLAVNLLTLVRGVALMAWLDYSALGLIALVQSVIAFGGMLHFGLLNGGYRLLCHAKGNYRQRIVDTVYSAFAVLFAGLIIGGIAAGALVDTVEYRVAAALTVTGAIATLVRAWIGNEMVATGQLGAVNALNAVSITVSLAALAFIGFDPAVVGILSIVLQPVAFVLAAFLTRSAMRPRRLSISKRLVALILRAGFLVFLTGIALQLNTQMERWYIGGHLGIASLGRLYLAFLFLTLFQMVPTLLDQVFLPNLVKAHNGADTQLVRREMRLLLLLYGAYSAIAVVGVLTLAEPVLALVLPRYVVDVHWVRLLLPGVILFALSNPFALVFNVLIDYRWYLWAYGAGTLATAIAFGFSIASDRLLNLDQAVVLRSAIFGLMGLVLIFGSHSLTRKHRAFRPFGRAFGVPARKPEALL